jgi:hypothetical protein
MSVVCSKAEVCGARMIPSEKDKKILIPSCRHMVEHDHTFECDNPVCMKVAPQNAACVPVEIPTKTISEIVDEVLSGGPTVSAQLTA